MFTTAVNGSYPLLPEPPRPQHLKKALDDHETGLISDQDLERAKFRALVEAVAEMVAAGVETVNGGYVRTGDIFDYTFRTLAGFEPIADREIAGSDDSAPRFRATDKVEWVRPLLVDEYRFISERSPVTTRPVLPGPYSLARNCELSFYVGGRSAFIGDAAKALNRELLALSEAGAEWILIEESLAHIPYDDAGEFVIASFELCDTVSAKVMLGTGVGDVCAWQDALRDSAFAGFGFDLMGDGENESLLAVRNYWKDRVIQIGLLDASSPRIETPMEVALGAIKFCELHDPDLTWVAPNVGMGTLNRDVAFEKLTNMCRGVEWSRRELMRREAPG